jgi:hypothetical protein
VVWLFGLVFYRYRYRFRRPDLYFENGGGVWIPHSRFRDSKSAPAGFLSDLDVFVVSRNYVGPVLDALRFPLAWVTAIQIQMKFAKPFYSTRARGVPDRQLIFDSRIRSLTVASGVSQA